MDDAQADAEAGLRGGAERPDDGVDDHQVDRHERELGAGGQADLEHRRPEVEARLPVGDHELEVGILGLEVEQQPDRAHRDGDEGGERRAGHAERAMSDPAEDQERRQHHVEEHGDGLDHHAGLEVAGAPQRRAHGHHSELERRGGNEPQQVIGGQCGGAGVGAQASRVDRTQRHHEDQEHRAGQHREHLRLVEHQQRAVVLLPTGGVGDQRGGADAEHLRHRQHDEHQVAADADRRHRFLAEATHPVEIDQEVEGLEQHGHQHEAGGAQQVPGDRAGGEVLHYRRVSECSSGSPLSTQARYPPASELHFV